MNLDDPSNPKILRSPFRRRASCVREEAPAGAVVAAVRLEVHWVATEAEVEAISWFGAWFSRLKERSCTPLKMLES